MLDRYCVSCHNDKARSDGTPLVFDERWIDEPHAYAKLWKHHAAGFVNWHKDIFHTIREYHYHSPLAIP